MLHHIRSGIVSPDPALRKVVVFSQSVSALTHAAKVLLQEGIGHVAITSRSSSKVQKKRSKKRKRGEEEEEEQESLSQVQRFNIDPECFVLLLHASTAAAGLTLTVARRVLLLEPFMRAGEEAQAMNRCHRIGQCGTVEVTVLYLQDSVEQRLLAYREQEAGTWSNQGRGRRGVGGTGDQEDGLSVLPGGFDFSPNKGGGKNAKSVEMKSRGGLSLRKLKFLFGLEDAAASGGIGN